MKRLPGLCAFIVFAALQLHGVCFAQITGNSIKYTAGRNGVCGETSFTALDKIYGSVSPALAGGSAPYTYKWLKSFNIKLPFSVIAGAVSADYYIGTITQTTLYKRVVISGSLSDTTAPVFFYVHINKLTGNNVFIAADKTTEHDIPCGTPSYRPGLIGYNANEGNFGGGGTGDNDHFQWLASTDNGITFTSAKDAGGIPVQSEGYTPGAIKVTTWYVRVVSSGVCTNQSAPVKFIFGATSGNFIKPPAILSSCGSASFTPQTIVGSTLPSGYTYAWQSGPDTVTYTTIPGETGQNLSPAAITSTTAYRRVATSSGGCVSNTNSVVFSVAPPFSSNIIGAKQLVDSAATPAQLTGAAVMAGSNIISYSWQTSTDSLGTYVGARGVNAAQDYQPGPAIAPAYYRRLASSGACTSISNIIKINVKGVKPPPPPPPPPVTCIGAPSTADMGISIFHLPGAKTSGASFVYTVAITDTGPDDATNVVVTDTLAANVRLASVEVLSGDKPTYDAATHVLTWQLASLRKTVIAQAIITVIPLSNDQIISKIGVTASPQCDPNHANNNRRDTINDPLPIFPAKNIPDIITPNGDGKNDSWVIKSITSKAFANNSVVIIDRWGNTVFSATGYQNTWDGAGLSAGTYFYVLKINNSATTLNFKGYITLMR